MGNAALPAKLPGEDDAGNGSTTVFLLVVFVLSLLMVNPLAAGAADDGVYGTAYYDAARCPTPRPGIEGFTDYDGLVLTGSLQGCWYTSVETARLPAGLP